MNDELEDRLRRTYRAVGEHTVVGAGERSAELWPVASQPSSSTRWA